MVKPQRQAGLKELIVLQSHSHCRNSFKEAMFVWGSILTTGDYWERNYSSGQVVRKDSRR